MSTKLKKIKFRLIQCFDAIFSLLRFFFRLLIELIIILLLISIGFFLGVCSCDARTIYYGSESERVILVYGGPTILRFDEEVQTISQASKFLIQPADTRNPNYAMLSVTPRFTKGKTKISFILANGAVVNTQMLIVSKATPEQSDSFYDFLPKKNLIESRNEKGSQISDLELIKAMIRWDKVLGYRVSHFSRPVSTGTRGVSARLLRLYVGPRYSGYVFQIENNSRRVYAIDLTKLTLGRPNLALLSQVDHKTLKPKRGKNKTYLRVVAKPTAAYHQISLPIAPAQEVSLDLPKMT